MSDISTVLTEWTAAERTGDVTTVDRLLTDDFVGVGPLGFALPKDAWIGRHRGGDLVYDAFDLDEVDEHRHGDATVVIARHDARGAYQGHPLPEALRATVVLVHDDAPSAPWQLASLHLSFIAGTPGAPPIPGAPGQTGSP
jgi:ketosteroid isomerase-like protein